MMGGLKSRTGSSSPSRLLTTRFVQMLEYYQAAIKRKINSELRTSNISTEE